jgi:hypothetical protein
MTPGFVPLPLDATSSHIPPQVDMTPGFVPLPLDATSSHVSPQGDTSLVPMMATMALSEPSSALPITADPIQVAIAVPTPTTTTNPPRKVTVPEIESAIFIMRQHSKPEDIVKQYLQPQSDLRDAVSVILNASLKSAPGLVQCLIAAPLSVIVPLSPKLVSALYCPLAHYSTTSRLIHQR